MEKIKILAKLSKVERINNNFYGNPRYEAVYETACKTAFGYYLKGKTSSNSDIGYTILNNQFDTKILTYHVTRTGNIIFEIGRAHV